VVAQVNKDNVPDNRQYRRRYAVLHRSSALRRRTRRPI